MCVKTSNSALDHEFEVTILQVIAKFRILHNWVSRDTPSY